MTIALNLTLEGESRVFSSLLDIYALMLDHEQKKIQRNHAYKLADKVLAACNGAYHKAIRELRGALDCRENAHYEIHLEALGLLRKWKRKIARDHKTVNFGRTPNLMAICMAVGLRS